MHAHVYKHAGIHVHLHSRLNVQVCVQQRAQRKSERAGETEMETEGDGGNWEGGDLLRVLTLQEPTCVCRSIIFSLLSLGF